MDGRAVPDLGRAPGRARGAPCSYFGPDLGVLTGGGKVRYPDALVTCTKFPGTDRLAPDPVALFEVLSPDSGRRDRAEEVRDYASVPSIRQHVIVESAASGLLVLYRQSGGEPFTALPLTADDVLTLPGTCADIPVAELYEDVEFDEAHRPA